MTTLTPGTKQEPAVVTAEFNPFAPGMLADPYAMYRALREHDPIHRSEMMESWVLTRYDDIDAVLMDNRFSSDRTRAETSFSQMMREQQEQYESSRANHDSAAEVGRALSGPPFTGVMESSRRAGPR